MPGFDWNAWATPQGIEKATEWVISQPSFFKSFAEMVPKTPLATLEGVDGRTGHHDECVLPEQAVRRSAIRVLHKTLSGRSSSGSGGRGRPARQRVDGRSARPAVRAEVLSRPRRRRGWKR
jgi:hypothetical protein